MHSPLARLEALQSLLSDRGRSDQNDVLGDSASVATSISAVTSGTGLSGSGLPVLSLFTLTRNLRDLHLELINKLLLPQLLAILAPEYDIKGLHSSIPMTLLSPLSDSTDVSEPFDYVREFAEAEFLLLKFAVRVIGLLFKSRSGDAEKRLEYVGLLKHIAVSKPHVISTWKASDDPSLAERLDLEIFRLQLEAIRQLELCLHTPFRDLPHTHAAAPAMLNALCEVVHHYSSKQSEVKIDHHTDSILCLASIIPLARLSCTRNGHGIFLPRERVTSVIPSVFLSILGDDGWIECCSPMVDLGQSLPMVIEEPADADENDDIAQFVYVQQGQFTTKDEGNTKERNEQKRVIRRHSSGRSDKAVIEIEPVASVIKAALCAHKKCAIGPTDLQTDFSPIIRLVCFNTLSSFLSHGISFPNPVEDAKWLRIEAESVEELVARSEAVSLLATVIGNVLLSKRLKMDTGEALIIQTCQVLVRLAVEHMHPTVVKNACCGLVTLLLSMRKKSRKGSQSQVSEALLTDTLTPLIQHMCNILEDREAWSGSVLVPLSNGELVLCI